MKTMNELRSVLGMNEVHHLPLLIKGVAVTLLGTFGIAAVMAWMPTSTDVADVIFSFEKLLAPSASTVNAEAQILPTISGSDTHVRLKCAECSVVESIREIKQNNDEIDPGAAIGISRDGLNETPEKSTRSYEITVRMKDGSSRVLVDATPVNWRPGERVVFIEGASRSNE